MLCRLCLSRLNSPAIVYKTTRNVIPTFENINAVKARQWSFARSNGGFCLRRTDRFRSILLPSSFGAGPLSNRPRSHTLPPLSSHSEHGTQLDILLNITSYVFSAPSSKKRCTRSTMGGVGEQSVSASVALVRLTAHFIFGLNFIAKVYHNQNFMLAPPLSSAGLETTLFGFRMWNLSRLIF